MRSKIATAVIGFMFATGVNAANWYGFTAAGNEKAVYYFDRDTVEKKPGSVTLWIKYVNAENSPDADGSYSTASKYMYECTTRKYQALLQVTYAKDHSHIKTYSKPGDKSEVVPGTIAEAILKIVCTADFPALKSNAYIKIEDNDIYASAKRYLDAAYDPAPK